MAGVIEAGKTMRLYINGVQVVTGTASALPPAVSRTSNFIGKSNWQGDSLVDGALTDVRIWNIARTAAQIQTNMSVGSIAGPTTGLVAAYLMGSTGAGPLADVSGNNYTATLVGSPTYTKMGAGTLSTGGFVGSSSLNITAGKLVLGGTNTYSGDTIVNGGTLAVNGTSIPNTGNLVIQSGKVEPTGTESVSALYFGTAQQGSGTWGATGSGAAHIDDARFSGSGMIKVISHDATMSNLALASITLNPVFSSATTSYTASVGNLISSTTVTPTLSSTLAAVTVNGVTVASGSASASIPLTVGSNTITMLVTAEDGMTTKTYTVMVTRAPSSVATLSGLVLSSGSLSPTFAAASASYTASVTNATTSITVRPIVMDATATMKVNGTTLASGATSQSIPLVAGPNTINVVVTAQDGVTQTTYTVTVTRVFLDAVFTSAGTVPFSSLGYNATSNAVNVSLGYAPTVGTNLTLVENTGLAFITGKFSNLAQGQVITLGYHNASYRFVVNYYGGTGNDLVLQWANDKSYAWGSDSYGQLGDSGVAGPSSNVPVAVTSSGVLSGKTILSISTGSAHSLALCADGTLAAWGRNNYGQLGTGDNTDSSVPVTVIQSGVLADKTVVAVSAGFSHSLALCADGTVACWGYNLYGQLGNNTFGSAAHSNVPVLVTTSGVLNGKMVTSIVAGYYHNLALCADGTVVAWGRNNSGQLGNNSIIDSSVPVNITNSGTLNGRSAVTLAAGSDHSLVLCEDGSLVSWGKNTNGQLGDGSIVPSLIPLDVDATDVLAGRIVEKISAGGFHNLVACADGTLVAFGRNTNGQLGNNSTQDSSMPVVVARTECLIGKTVTALQAANAHSLALCSDGSIASWGSGSNGMLGNGGGTNSNVPVAVTASGVGSGEKFIALASGPSASHSMALTALPLASGSTLASLVLGAGTLSPTFTAGTLSYAASVPNATTSITVMPTVIDAAGTVTVNGTLVASGSASGLIPLTVGPNTIITVVIPQDGVALTTYTVTVTRISNVSTLAGLGLSTGTLSPAFATDTTAYTANVPNTMSSITVTPTVTNTTASVKVNGATMASESASGAISLGSSTVNTITVVVTAQDGITTTTYTVTIDNTPFGIWQKNTFTTLAAWSDPAISGDLATPAHDGITNLMKYALALPPMTCGTDNLPTMAQQDGYLTLTYRKNKTATDVTYTVQAADSLDGNAWAPATTVLSQTDGGSYWLVTVRDSVRYAGQSRRFMRLWVEK